MALSTRQLASFVQKVAKLQPQEPPVYGGNLRGCTTCIPTLSGLGDLSAVPWGWVAGAAVVGAGAMWYAAKKRVIALRKAKKARKSRKARKARRNRRR